MKETIYRSPKAPGFSFTFDPVEDTINITNTPSGTIIRYASIDSDPFNPRVENDHLGTMVCFHTLYNLGDKGHGYHHGDYNGWEGLRDKLVEDGAWVILPVYLLDHSGLRIACGDFGDKWDSGQVGFIFMTRAKAVENWGNLPELELQDKAMSCLKSEIEVYDQYLTGDVYGIVKETYNADKESIDCDHCWGFIGFEYASSEVAGFEKDPDEDKPAKVVTRKIEFEKEEA